MTVPPFVGGGYMRAMAILESARVTAAISVTAIGLAFTSRLLRALIGWPGFIAALAVLVLLACASLFARRKELEWRGLLPISLLLFVGWCALSVLWTDYQWASLAGVAYQIAFCILGIYVALVRDLIQVIRAVGDVVRFTLVLSAVLEVFSGLLIDAPIRFLGIDGGLGSGAPIQGIFGTRNLLGIVALIGVVTFATEFLTKSVNRTTSVISLCLALFGLILTRSPVVTGAALAVTVGALLLYGLRRLRPQARRISQFVGLGLLSLALVVAWVLRTPIIALLNAGSEFEVRYDHWRQILGFSSIRPIEGWGWVGLWRTDLQPFLAIDAAGGHQHASAFDALIDVLLQAGIVGLFCFVVLLALTFGRSWLIGANQRSVQFVWPALVLIVLLVASLAESVILVEFGWLLFVTCAMIAAHRLSWRSSYEATPAGGTSDRSPVE